MALKLYCDLMSQPSRALYILLKYINSDFEPKLINLAKGEQYSEEFSAINRLSKVPVIDHNGFVLTESVAILKYLSRENIIPESLYPKDSKLQARVEEFLEWQHAGLRLPCSMYFVVNYLNPVMFGKTPNPTTLAGYESRMETALTVFDTKWLGRGTQFITGNTPTVADLLAACELEQTRMARYEPSEKFKNIDVWWKKVREHFNPYYDEGHVIVNKVIKKNATIASKI